MTDAEILELGKRRAEELNLCPHSGHLRSPDSPGFTEYYRAPDVHRLLGYAREVQSICQGEWQTSWPEDGKGFSGNTHQAFILGIRPIKKESREDKMEKLLTDFIDKYQHSDCGAGSSRYLEYGRKLFNEAKALLEREP